MKKANFREVTETKTDVSRRKFIKTAGVAAGLAGVATVAGLTIGPSALPMASGQTSSSYGGSYEDSTNYNPTYSAKQRYYYLYATDGFINVPDPNNPLGSHRGLYIYGFCRPITDTRPLGSTEPLSLNPADANFAFKDLSLIDPNTANVGVDPAPAMPIMMGKAQLPAPTIWGVEGDVINITLFNLGFLYRNDIMDPHTIHAHGMHAPTAYDGIPELSFGIPMWANREQITSVEALNKYSFTYKIYCERPGTYMYHCHVEASEHVQMGMYGSLAIYPKHLGTKNGLGGWAYGNPKTAFEQEAYILLSEMDTRWHDMLWNPTLPTPGPDPTLQNFNPVDYRPNYWLINGRSFPDTVLPARYDQGYQPIGIPTSDTTLTYYPPVTINGKTYNVPRQPVQTYVQTGVNQKVLVRLTNMGYQAQPMHFHGVMPKIIGKDTHAWVPTSNSMFSTPGDQTIRIFTQGIFSGETYDLISTYPDKSAISQIYRFINQNDPSPFSTWETFWGPTLNSLDPSIPLAQNVPSADDPNVLVPGLTMGYPLLYLWHVHDDYKVTNDGAYPGGAATLVKVLKKPPEPKPAIPLNGIPV